MLKVDSFFTSGFEFDVSLLELKSRYQMLNIGLLLSAISLTYAVILNYFRGTHFLIPIEVFLVVTDIVLFFVLRLKREYFEYVTTAITTQFTFLFLVLLYMSDPVELKHVWLFTYPIILLYFQGTKRGHYWFSFLIFMIFIAPIQPFFDVQYSLYQVTYIIFALVVVNIVIQFYQQKIDEARKIIIEQQNNLKSQIEELEKKDKLLTAQSRQAVMGEMISMIAHQWRQPLSTITLQISNYQISQLLNKNIRERAVDKTLAEISDTIIYLSDTIDDFQTYFHPDKELTEIEAHTLVEKCINFVLPRLKERKVNILFEHNDDITLTTYQNELVQVILNLLNNAIDVLYEMKTDKHLKIILNVKQIEKHIYISIEDNAGGISNINLPHIFEPYFSTKGKNGTGLGLYMSQMIIQKQFHGDISVKTSPNGSIFTIEIPESIV